VACGPSHAPKYPLLTTDCPPGSMYGMLNETDYWFLPTLFLLRVLILPFLSTMRTRCSIPCHPVAIFECPHDEDFPLPLQCASALLLYNTGDSVSDGSEDNTYIARTFIYLPYYVAGFLGKRHQLFDRYLQVRK
jgi:hypothetical protein